VRPATSFTLPVDGIVSRHQLADTSTSSRTRVASGDVIAKPSVVISRELLTIPPRTKPYLGAASQATLLTKGKTENPLRGLAIGLVYVTAVTVADCLTGEAIFLPSVLALAPLLAALLASPKVTAILASIVVPAALLLGIPIAISRPSNTRSTQVWCSP
jgi:hypothetical protein